MMDALRNEFSERAFFIRADFYACGEEPPSDFTVVQQMTKDILREWFGKNVCAVFGHDLIEEVTQADCGATDLYCRRCGWSASYFMDGG